MIVLTDKELKERVAQAIAVEKAQRLLGLCRRIGLDIPDDPDEEARAWRSKHRFVLSYLEPLNRAAILAIAERANEVLDSFDLAELLALATREQTITEITRRGILDYLRDTYDLAQLGGKLRLLDLLQRVWPLERMPSEDLRFPSAAGEFWQHTENNPSDYEFDHLLVSRLGLHRSSDALFLRFLESLVDPLTREGEEQSTLVGALNDLLRPDGWRLVATGDVSGRPIYRSERLTGGITRAVKNLIFAADGPKPELVLSDALHNDVIIARYAEHCLVFEETIPAEGLSWRHLVRWWQRSNVEPLGYESARDGLYRRLDKSLRDSPVEKPFFYAYFARMLPRLAEALPALIPQVYLHYDPATAKERARRGAAGGLVLPRQRMDFLLLLPNRVRVVLELDGKQHYADGDVASPRRYAEMVAADRDLRLAGYEIYRFGGAELGTSAIDDLVEDFFCRLFARHGLL